MSRVSCSFFLRLCSEVPILEDTLMRILVIGLSRDLPLGPADAMELADHLVKRAAAVQADGEAAQSSHQQVLASVSASSCCHPALRQLLPPTKEPLHHLKHILVMMAKHLAQSQTCTAVAFSLEKLLIFSYCFSLLLILYHGVFGKLLVVCRMKDCEQPPRVLSQRF